MCLTSDVEKLARISNTNCQYCEYTAMKEFFQFSHKTPCESKSAYCSIIFLFFFTSKASSSVRQIRVIEESVLRGDKPGKYKEIA